MEQKISKKKKKIQDLKENLSTLDKGLELSKSVSQNLQSNKPENQLDKETNIKEELLISEINDLKQDKINLENKLEELTILNQDYLADCKFLKEAEIRNEEKHQESLLQIKTEYGEQINVLIEKSEVRMQEKLQIQEA